MINNEVKLEIIKDAQKLLSDASYDLLHDNYHHYRVWENCVEIYFIDKPQVNINLLEVATWWHDYEKSDIGNSQKMKHSDLRTTLEKYMVSQENQEKIIKIIEEHTFESNQSLEESKILFDADKLEYISIPRWYLSNQFIEDDVRNRYEIKFANSLESIKNRLHYDYSREIFNKRLTELSKIVKLNNWFLDKSKMNF